MPVYIQNADGSLCPKPKWACSPSDAAKKRKLNELSDMLNKVEVVAEFIKEEIATTLEDLCKEEIATLEETDNVQSSAAAAAASARAALCYWCNKPNQLHTKWNMTNSYRGICVVP